MSDDLVKLRELAEKATPGPWRTFYEGSGDYIVLSDEDEVASLSRPDAHFMATGPGASINEANAQFIAAANPQAIVVLLDRIEALQRLCGYAQHHHTCPAALDHFEPDGNEPAPCSCGLAELREAEKGMK